VPVDRLREAMALGLTEFGENRVQDVEAKAAALPGARWQLVGHLQSNKAGRAVELFEAIQSVDTVGIAQRLDRLAARHPDRGPLPVFLQVNVDRDPAKQGFDPDEMPSLITRLAELDGLMLAGLMTVGRLVAGPEEARSTFKALRQLSERLHSIEPRLGGGLSMGMSDDFELAVEEGATAVRIGRALFGERLLG
jgi:PLP dependent protein